MSDEPTVLYEATDTNLTWRISLSDGQLVLAVETATGPLKQMAHWIDQEQTGFILHELGTQVLA